MVISRILQSLVNPIAFVLKSQKMRREPSAKNVQQIDQVGTTCEGFSMTH